MTPDLPRGEYCKEEEEAIEKKPKAACVQLCKTLKSDCSELHNLLASLQEISNWTISCSAIMNPEPKGHTSCFLY